MVWGCLSHDCKLDLVTICGNLTGERYIREVLQPVIVPHFDNHPLATRPVFMDDNARPHRARAVTEFLRQEAVTTLPWPAMSPDLNPLEHIWDMLGRRIQTLDPPPQSAAIGSCTASGVAASDHAADPASDWKYATQGGGSHPRSRRIHAILIVFFLFGFWTLVAIFSNKNVTLIKPPALVMTLLFKGIFFWENGIHL